MKILCGPDLHIRVTAPEHRIDDFVETQKHKIKWILKLANKHNCEIVLLPGDITDHPKLPYHISQHYIRKFRFCPFKIIGTWGQHDLLYHVGKENTPLYTMEAGGAVILPRIQPYVHTYEGESVHIYTVGWEDEIPELDDSENINILLIHKMFVLDKLWEGQEEFIRTLIFLKRTKWDLIVSGDNHQHFMSFATGDRFHVNCGSLMRQNIDQKNHKPVVYIYDTVERTLKKYDIPIDPIEDVMDLEKAEEEKQERLELQAFVESIEETTEIEGLDFVKNFSGRLEQEDINPGVRELGQEVLRKAGEAL